MSDLITNRTGKYLALHAEIESEGAIVRRHTTSEPFVRRGRAIDFWWIKQALKYAQRRAYWMNVARRSTHQFSVEQAIKHARSSNRDMLWAIRGARKYS